MPVTTNAAVSAVGYQRHRREGTRPVGKTARRMGIGQSAARNPTLAPMIAASTTSRGSDPGDVRIAYVVVSWPNTETRNPAPTAIMSQPRWLRAREATMAPVVR
jgi:hypothetical protein